jgi:hypothetical protein
MRDFLVFCAFVALALSIILGIAGALMSYSCYATWKDSPFEARYGLWTNCQIKTPAGWVPASSYVLMQEKH